MGTGTPRRSRTRGEREGKCRGMAGRRCARTRCECECERMVGWKRCGGGEDALGGKGANDAALGGDGGG